MTTIYDDLTYKMNQEPQEPKVISIIMATYNRSRLLARAINSIMVQSYPYFEIIIVDDCSPDDTEELVKSVNDKRLRYFKLEHNKGMSIARNKGLDLAQGYYISIMDDDDVLLPGALETVINEFNRLHSKGINAPWIWFPQIDAETSELVGHALPEEGYISYEDELGGKISGNFFIIIESQLLNHADRFDPQCWGYENLFWLKLFRKSRAFYIPKALYEYHTQHNSRVSDFENQLKHLPGLIYAAKTFLQTFGNDLKNLSKQSYASAMYTLGTYQLLNGEKVEGRRTLWESFKYRFSSFYSLFFFSSCLLNNHQLAFFCIKYMNMKNKLHKRFNKQNK
jgi:glycosyltransferase involved in cell wall biosynthesis